MSKLNKRIENIQILANELMAESILLNKHKERNEIENSLLAFLGVGAIVSLTIQPTVRNYSGVLQQEKPGEFYILNRNGNKYYFRVESINKIIIQCEKGAYPINLVICVNMAYEKEIHYV